jgi:hypothetical protein
MFSLNCTAFKAWLENATNVGDVTILPAGFEYVRVEEAYRFCSDRDSVQDSNSHLMFMPIFLGCYVLAMLLLVGVILGGALCYQRVCKKK